MKYNFKFEHGLRPTSDGDELRKKLIEDGVVNPRGRAFMTTEQVAAERAWLIKRGMLKPGKPRIAALERPVPMKENLLPIIVRPSAGALH